MPGRLKTYAFINAKLRSRLSRILSGEFVQQLARAPSLPEAVQLLRGTPFAAIEEIYRQTGDLKLGELELFRQEVSLYLEVESLVAGRVKEFVHALAVRFEIDTLKNALRVWFDRKIRGRETAPYTAYLYRDRIHHDLPVDSLIELNNLDEVAHLLRDTPYAPIIRENIHAALTSQNIFPIEIALDQYFYRQLLQAAARLKQPDRVIAQRIVGVEVDLQNIDWIVRFKLAYNLPLDEAIRYVLPFGQNVGEKVIRAAYNATSETEVLATLLKNRYPPLRALLSSPGTETRQRMAFIEHILDQILQTEVRRVLSGYPFTIGIVLAYFTLKHNEIKRVMTILNAKYYQIPVERIQGLL